MTKLFIPTRNRPSSLSKVLEYLVAFYPDTNVIVADGSDEQHQQQNKTNIDNFFSSLSIDYRQYPADLNLVERCKDVLHSLKDELIVWGSDDDFPNMDLMHRGADFLKENTAYVTAMGATIDIIDIDKYKISIPRPIVSNKIHARMKYYSKNSFPTTYAVTRINHIIKRIEHTRFYGQPGFFDFVTGLYDINMGKLHAFPDIGFFATYSPNHSRLRPDNKLHFLYNSDQVLAIHSAIVEDLKATNELEPNDVSRIAQRILLNRIAEISGWGFKKSAKFLESKAYLDPVVQSQYQIFEDLFKEGTETHQKYAEHIKFIQESLKFVESSDDNKGESVYNDKESFRF